MPSTCMFTRHIYTLESDGLIIFKAADLVAELSTHVQIVRQGGAGVPQTRGSVGKTTIDDEFPFELQTAKDERVL
jgi:hypothetical protein